MSLFFLQPPLINELEGHGVLGRYARKVANRYLLLTFPSTASAELFERHLMRWFIITLLLGSEEGKSLCVQICSQYLSFYECSFAYVKRMLQTKTQHSKIAEKGDFFALSFIHVFL